MIDDIRYYPLVCIDSDGSEYTAMIPSDREETVRECHKLWLSEFVRNCYRLCAGDKPSVNTVNSLRLHCPKCGTVLKTISSITKEYPFPLYTCEKCSVQH